MSVSVRCPNCNHLDFVQPEDLLTACVTCFQCGTTYAPTGPEPEPEPEPVPVVEPEGQDADRDDRSFRRRRDRVRSGRPEDILSPKEYLNYQHGRILSGLLVFAGSMFLLVGVTQAVSAGSDTTADPPASFWAVCAGIGLVGVIGGGAAYQGSRTWSWLGYPFAVLLLFGIPIGTIISVLWMMGRSRHLAAAEQLRRARREEH